MEAIREGYGVAFDIFPIRAIKLGSRGVSGIAWLNGSHDFQPATKLMKFISTSRASEYNRCGHFDYG